MANTVIAHLVEDAVVLWTDGAFNDETYSHRNVVPVGNNCVALHDKVEDWLGQLVPILSDTSLASYPLNELVDALVPQLQALRQSVPQNIGVVVAGFQSQGAPQLVGLHSGRNFDIRRFSPSVIGNLPPCIWNYLVATLSGIPNTFDNVVDKLLLAGDAYHDVFLSGAGFPKSSAVAVLRFEQGLSWMPTEELSERLARNAHRTYALNQYLVREFIEAGL